MYNKNNYNQIIVQYFQIIYTKMMLILGVPWICESIHFFVHRQFPHCHPDTSIELVFGFVGTLNYSRGIFIFIFFCCKPDIVNKLKRLSIVIGLRRLIANDNDSSNEWIKERRYRNGTFRTDISS